MDTHEIVITGAYSNGRLDLMADGKDGQEVIVKKGDKVIWSIAKGVAVDTFRIEEKDDSEQIFSLLYRPPKEHTKKGEARVSLFNRKGAKYKYSIWWKRLPNSDELEHDPKISIDPSKGNSIGWLIAGLVAFLLSAFGMFWFVRNRQKRS